MANNQIGLTSEENRRASLETLLQAVAKPIPGDDWFSAALRMQAVELQIKATEDAT